jgi:hypothetical protein
MSTPAKQSQRKEPTVNRTKPIYSRCVQCHGSDPDDRYEQCACGKVFCELCSENHFGAGIESWEWNGTTHFLVRPQLRLFRRNSYPAAMACENFLCQARPVLVELEVSELPRRPILICPECGQDLLLELPAADQAAEYRDEIRR